MNSQKSDERHHIYGDARQFRRFFCDRVILLKDGTVSPAAGKSGSRSAFQDELLTAIKEMSE